MDTNKLPDTLSGLLRLAVEDSKLSEQQGHELDMGTWCYKPEGGEKCIVCMAGAVMLQRLKPEYEVPGEGHAPAMYSKDTRPKLHAINDMREGQFLSAYRQIHSKSALRSDSAYDVLDAVAGIVISAYNDYDHRAPWSTYLKVANILEKAGL